MNKVAIVGLGYVGLPLSLQFARSGVTTLGLDIDAAKVRAITAGKSYIQHMRQKFNAQDLFQEFEALALRWQGKQYKNIAVNDATTTEFLRWSSRITPEELE